MLDIPKTDLLNMDWLIGQSEDEFSRTKWNAETQHTDSEKSPTKAFSRTQNKSPMETKPLGVGEENQLPNANGFGRIRNTLRSPWSPKPTEDLLHESRENVQNCVPPKFADLTLHTNDLYDGLSSATGGAISNAATNATTLKNYSRVTFDKHLSSGSGSTSSTTSLDFHVASSLWNSRPTRQFGRNRLRPAKICTLTFNKCCGSPSIQVICTACNERHRPKIVEEMRTGVAPFVPQPGFCRFCESNGDPPEVYRSHSLRSEDGRVTCPVLREYSCPICKNGGGDYAHTIKYCPFARSAKP